MDFGVLSELTAEDIAQTWKYLKADEREQVAKLLALIPPTLAEFVERTLKDEAGNFVKLDNWQVHLCNRLERLSSQTGQRIAIHAPPQWGKSVITAQRLAPYLIGCNPYMRVGLASYTLENAVVHSKIVKEIMTDIPFREMFAHPGLRIPDKTREAFWSTNARLELKDGQPSFLAMGLESGFVGRGVDLLIVDDPYPSARDANSVSYNANLRMWWDSTVKPRLNPNTNVVVMFHRYNSNDFIAHLLQEGCWEYIRYAAIADGDEEYPDPLGRKPGELLSPRPKSLAQLKEVQENDPLTWWGQYQGLPRPLAGGYFQAEWFQETEDYSPFIDELPPLESWVRAYDMATSAKQSADYTAGALMGVTEDGVLILADVVRWRKEWGDTEQLILEAHRKDMQLFGKAPILGIEEDGVGKLAYDVLSRNKELLGTPLHKIKVRGKGDKKQRADVWQSKLQNGKFKMLRGEWNSAFIAECLHFRGLHERNDQVDAVSNGAQLLASVRGGEAEREEPLNPNTQAYFDKLAELFSIEQEGEPYQDEW